jgi:hypothetical protein
MISMLHQSGRVGHGRPEHSGTSGVKNRLIKSGVSFGGGGKIGSKTMKAQSVEADKKKKIVKKKKKKVTDNPEYKSVMDRMYA